eukprot:CAMPEP_0184302296 /NCGR_PEP_ID=MMETSP1049-20130417/12305_1 /TAXON_ID=77928 /ORGANISM="Proteomonas sulcata, Strain CCMP704" /LENGTH=169 /DNA_ID=CAMNT_0026613557 /DNA_START=869 /DNA_END=1380 /DNA_ORIENTATION=-
MALREEHAREEESEQDARLQSSQAPRGLPAPQAVHLAERWDEGMRAEVLDARPDRRPLAVELKALEGGAELKSLSSLQQHASTATSPPASLRPILSSSSLSLPRAPPPPADQLNSSTAQPWGRSTVSNPLSSAALQVHSSRMEEVSRGTATEGGELGAHVARIGEDAKV